MNSYGKELILDLHECDSTKFTRYYIKKYFIQLCDLIEMERCDLYFWDYKGYLEEYDKAPDHLKGTSAVQFISTSNIVVHTLDILGKVFINIFSCKDFSEEDAADFSAKIFGGTIANKVVLKRL